MSSHIIPVVFEMNTVNTGAVEMNAAQALAKALGVLDLPGTEVMLFEQRWMLESWHMQNHPMADGSDHEATIIFLPLRFDERRTDESSSQQAQRNIDEFLETTKRWL